jgi:type I restriction enzyme S subunit
MEVTHLAADIELPAGWHQPRVIDIAARRANATVGGPFGSDLVAKDYVDSGVPVIRGQNMGHRYVSGEFAFVSPAKAKALQANLARPSDLVFTQRGTLGQVALVPTGPYKEYLISQSQMKLTLDCGAAAPGYVHQYFASALGQKQILDSAIQTGVPHTNLGILRNYAVPMPRRVDEQDAIAAALTDADALIDSLEQLLTKKRQIKQGAMQELLTGKRRLPGFAGPWISCTWDDVIDDCSSGATPLRSCPEYYRGSIRWISSGELDYNVIDDTIEHISSEAFEKTNLKLHPAGTFLMAITGLEAAGTRGACGIVGKPATTNQSCMAIYPSNKLLTAYLFQYYVYKGDDLALRYCQGTKQQSYTAALIRVLPIEYPESTDEQLAIAQALSDIDAEIATLEARLTKASAFKQAMAQALLTGRIRLVSEGAVT